MANDNDDSKKIPNSSNIFSIVSEQYTDINKLIKAIAKNNVKNSDIIKIQLGVKRSKFAIKSIVKGFAELKAYLATQVQNESVDGLTTLLTDPVLFFRSLKNKDLTLEDVKNTKQMKVLESYIYLLKVLASVSEYGEKITFKGLLLLPKKISMAMNVMIDSLSIIKKKSKSFKPIGMMVELFMSYVPPIINSLLMNQGLLLDFVESTQKIKKKYIKRAIRTFFNSFVLMAIEIFKIGKFLITGKYDLDDDAFFGLITRKKKVQYNPVYLVGGLIIGKKFLTGLSKFLLVAYEAIDKLTKLGQFKKGAIEGLKTLDIVFWGNEKAGVYSIYNPIYSVHDIGIKDLIVTTAEFLAFVAMLTPIMLLVQGICLILNTIGKSNKAVKNGLKTLDMIFSLDGIGGRKSKLFGTKSLIWIINNVVTNLSGGAIAALVKFIQVSALLLAATTLMGVIALELAKIGTYRKKIKLGLKALDMIFSLDGIGERKSKLFGPKSLLWIINNVVTNLSGGAIFAMVTFIAISALLLAATTLMTLIASKLVQIGTFKKEIKSGLKTVNYVFFGSKDRKGKGKKVPGLIDIINIIASDNSIVINTIKFAGISLLLNVALEMFKLVTNNLFAIGLLQRKIKKGLKTINFVLFGKVKGKGDKAKVKVLGLVGIMEALHNDDELFDSVIDFMVFGLFTGIAFKTLTPLIDFLVELGRNRRKAKKGIDALQYILFGNTSKEGKGGDVLGLIGIMNNEEFQKTTLKTILESGLKLALIGGIFVVFTTILSVIGITGIAAFIGLIAVRKSVKALNKMIEGLTIVGDYKGDIAGNGQKILLLGAIYSTFISMLSSVANSMNEEKIFVLVEFINSVPKIVQSMITGLTSVDAYTGDIMTSGQKLMQLAFIYSTFTLALGTAGNILSKEGLENIFIFIGASPIMISVMITGFDIINEYQGDLNKDSEKLNLLISTYSKFALQFGIIGNLMTTEGLFRVLGFIMLSPIMIRKMRRGLILIDKYQGNVKESTGKIQMLANSYSLFMFKISTAGEAVTVEGLKRAIIFMMISPMLIRRMRKGLKVIDKYKGSIIKSTKALNTLAAAYSAFMSTIGEVGEKLSVGAIIKASIFIFISPMLIRFMKWGLNVVSNPKTQAAILSGGGTLGVMAAAYLGFAGSLVAISAVVALIPVVLILPFLGVVALSGLALAGIGLMLPLIIPGAIASVLIAGALIVLSASMLIVGLSLLALTMIFVTIRALIPDDDVINLTVKSVVKMIRGIGKILKAIRANLKFGAALAGILTLALVTGIMLLLVFNAVLFLAVGAVATLITLEMIDAVTQMVYQESTIIKLLVDNIDPIMAVFALISAAIAMVIMGVLLVTAIFTVALAGICTLIDFNKLSKNLGTEKGSKDGLIQILGGLCWGLFWKLPPIIVLVAVIARVAMILGVISILSISALMVKGLASLEIQEYDSNGNKTGEKIKMTKNDFETAKTNIESILDVIISPFITKDGKATETVKRLQLLKTRNLKKVMKNLAVVMKSIGRMSKTVANVSKLIVPDENQGFDANGKPKGWRQMSNTDFENFKTNTNTLVETIVGIFDPQTDQGKSFLRVMRRVHSGSKRKMRFISDIVGNIGKLSDIVCKMSNMLTPDTEQEGWMDKDGKIVKWRKLDKSDFENAGKNMMTIVDFICSPDGNSLMSKIKESKIEDMKKKTLKKFNLLMSSMEPISELIHTIIEMSTGIFPVAELDDNQHIKYDSKGNQIFKYMKFDEIPFGSTSKRIGQIIKFYLYHLRQVFSDGYYKNAIKDINKVMKDGLPTAGISDLIDHIIKIGTGQFPIIDIDKNGKPVGYNKDGSPKMKYINFDNTLITTATQNIAGIIKSYVDEMYKIVVDASGNTAEFTKKMNLLNSIFNGPTSVFTFITPLISTTEKIVAIKDSDIKKFPTSLNSIINAYIGALGLLKDNSFTDWKSIKEPFVDFVDTTSKLYKAHTSDNIPSNVSKTFSSTQKLLDKVNGMNPTKLEKMANISSNMAKFSTSINGNFDGLARAMNENIVTVLEKVQKSMKELKEFLEKLPDELSNSMSKVKVQTISTDKPTPDKPAPVVKDPHEERTPDNKPKKETAINQIDTLEELVIELGKCIQDGAIKTRR